MNTCHLFGLDLVDAPDMGSVVDVLMAPQPRDAKAPLVATPNVDDLVRLSHPEYGDLAALTRQARYLLPDGQPVVWASRWLGTPLRTRLTGADLLPHWWAALAHEERSTVVVAPSRHVAELLGDRHPRLATVVAPRLDSGDPVSFTAFVDTVAATIHRHQAHTLLVGIGFPHQQRLAQGLLDRDDGPESLIGLLGGAFDLFTGVTPRAPHWMQRNGLEWAYRLGREPRRLARRYLLDDPAFLALLWQERRATTRGRTS